jgi:hypothetical protein
MSTEPGGSAGPQPVPGPRKDPRALPDPAVLPLVPGLVRQRPPRRPLPDAVAVRMLAIPDPAPPYDDELAAAASAARADGSPPGRPALPDGQLPPGTPAPATTPAPPGNPAPATTRALPGTLAPATSPAPPGNPAPATTPPLPGARLAAAASPGWPGTFAQVLAETLAGARPPRQIMPWTTDRARRHIQRLGPLLADGRQPRVRRVVTFRPAADVVEMTVIIGVGPRVRALAVRLERAGPRRASPGRDAQAARWVCTAVEAA